MTPSTKKGNTLLHILAKRNWHEYGRHNWDKYEELCRVAVKLAKSFPKEKGLDHRNFNGMTPLMASVSSGNEVMAFELVRGKCDINAVVQTPGQPDRTAMDIAACAKRSDILDHLSRHGGHGLCEVKETGYGYQKKYRRS